MAKVPYRKIKIYENEHIFAPDKEVTASFGVYRRSNDGELGWARHIPTEHFPVNPQSGVQANSITGYQAGAMLSQMVYGVHESVDEQKIQKIVKGNHGLISRIRRACKNSK